MVKAKDDGPSFSFFSPPSVKIIIHGLINNIDAECRFFFFKCKSQFRLFWSFVVVVYYDVYVGLWRINENRGQGGKEGLSRLSSFSFHVFHFSIY